LRLGTANPTEALKQIEELRKENMMLKDQVGKLQQMAPSIEALVKRIEELEKAKEGKAQN
jgi:cell division protein FtsB